MFPPVGAPRRRLPTRVGPESRRRCVMAEIRWTKDVDAALKEAKAAQKPVFLDFTAAPM